MTPQEQEALTRKIMSMAALQAQIPYGVQPIPSAVFGGNGPIPDPGARAREIRPGSLKMNRDAVAIDRSFGGEVFPPTADEQNARMALLNGNSIDGPDLRYDKSGMHYAQPAPRDPGPPGPAPGMVHDKNGFRPGPASPYSVAPAGTMPPAQFPFPNDPRVDMPPGAFPAGRPPLEITVNKAAPPAPMPRARPDMPQAMPPQQSAPPMPPQMPPPQAPAPMQPRSTAGMNFDPTTGRFGPAAGLNAGATFAPAAIAAFGGMGAQPQAPAAGGQPAGATPPSGGGFFDSIGNAVSGITSSPTFQDMMLGWASGGSLQDSLAKGALMVATNRQTRAEEKKALDQQNQTVNWLQTKGGYDADTAKLIASDKGMLSDVIKSVVQGNTLSPAELGLTPQYGVDANGNPVLIQIGKDGKAVQTKMPDGVTLSKEPIKLDAGTHFVLLDPITRQPVGTIPKDVAGEAAANATGKVQGEQIGAAPTVISNSDIALKGIDDVRNSDILKSGWGTGGWSYLNAIPGTQSYGFQQQVNQLKSGAFLTAIQQMQGMGALSNAEGQTATAALARLDTAQSAEDFKRALDDYEAVVKAGRARALQRMNMGQPLPAQPSGVTSTPDNDPLGVRNADNR